MNGVKWLLDTNVVIGLLKQNADYAKRNGWAVEQVERLLAPVLSY